MVDENPARAAFRRLRMLRAGADAGWYDYVAGDLRAGVHVVRINGRLRELRRDIVHWAGKSRRRVDEVPWWVTGIADSKSTNASALLDAIAAEPVPDLVTLNEAAELLSLSVEGVVNRLNTGKLYPVYLGPRERLLLRAQATGDTDTARQILTGLPPMHRLSALADYTGPAPSPHPLPIPTDQPEQTRRIQALMIGDQHEWFSYRSGDTALEQYVVELTYPDSEQTKRRVLPGEGVLPWVLGLADAEDDWDLIAYREGLG